MVCAAFEGRRAAHHRRDCCLAFEQQLHTGLQCQHGGLSGSCSKILLSGRLLFQDQPLRIELQGTRLLSSCCNKRKWQLQKVSKVQNPQHCSLPNYRSWPGWPRKDKFPAFFISFKHQTKPKTCRDEKAPSTSVSNNSVVGGISTRPEPEREKEFYLELGPLLRL